MKKFIHRIICIRTSRVIQYWGRPAESLAVRSLYLFGFRVKDIETRRLNRKELLRSFNSVI